MSRFAICDATSGVVDRVFEGRREDAEAQLQPGHALVEIVEALPERAHKRQTLVWDGMAFGWRDLRGLHEIKASKNAEINATRLAANRGTFQFDGRPIACDELSRSDIDGVNGYVGLTGRLPPDFPGVWKAADNSFVSIPSVQAWTDFYSAMVAAGTANFTVAQSLKAQLALAETAEDIESIRWPDSDPMDAPPTA